MFSSAEDLKITTLAVPLALPPAVNEAPSPQPFQHLLLPVLMITAILTVAEWHLSVVLICISVMATEVECLFTCLLAICMYSWERCLFRSSGTMENSMEVPQKLKEQCYHMTQQPLFWVSTRKV